jgi:hypothetical protein
MRGIILRAIAHEQIGIDADHSSVPPASIATCISSRLTGLAGRGMIPFRDLIEYKAGTSA